jgi:cytochrome c biogenesis protein CcdA
MILGVLVAMVELPCTGGPYLGILAMISNEMTRNQAIPYLLLYNLIFVLPLFSIMGAVYFGVPPERVEKVRVLSKGWVRLTMGAFLALFGIAMLFNLI